MEGMRRCLTSIIHYTLTFARTSIGPNEVELLKYSYVIKWISVYRVIHTNVPLQATVSHMLGKYVPTLLYRIGTPPYHCGHTPLGNIAISTWLLRPDWNTPRPPRQPPQKLFKITANVDQLPLFPHIGWLTTNGIPLLALTFALTFSQWQWDELFVSTNRKMWNKGCMESNHRIFSTRGQWTHLHSHLKSGFYISHEASRIDNWYIYKIACITK